MRVYLKNRVSEVIAGGDVLKVHREENSDGPRFFVDCNFEESEILRRMGMTVATPIPEVLEEAPPETEEAPEETAEEEAPAAEATPTTTPIKDLGLAPNVLASIRRKYKTVESLQGATILDLTGLKGIGEATARKIVKAAQSH